MSDWRQERKQRIEKTISESRGSLSDLLETINRNSNGKRNRHLHSERKVLGEITPARNQEIKCERKREGLRTSPLRTGGDDSCRPVTLKNFSNTLVTQQTAQQPTQELDISDSRRKTIKVVESHLTHKEISSKTVKATTSNPHIESSIVESSSTELYLRSQLSSSNASLEFPSSYEEEVSSDSVHAFFSGQSPGKSSDRPYETEQEQADLQVDINDVTDDTHSFTGAKSFTIPRRSEHVQRIIDRSLGDGFKIKTSAVERANSILYRNVNAVLASPIPGSSGESLSQAKSSSATEAILASPVFSPSRCNQEEKLSDCSTHTITDKLKGDQRVSPSRYRRSSSTDSSRRLDRQRSLSSDITHGTPLARRTSRVNHGRVSSPQADFTSQQLDKSLDCAERKVTRTSSTPASARYSPWKSISELTPRNKHNPKQEVNTYKSDRKSTSLCNSRQENLPSSPSPFRVSGRNSSASRRVDKFGRSASAPAAARKTVSGSVQRADRSKEIPSLESRKLQSRSLVPVVRRKSSVQRQSRVDLARSGLSLSGSRSSSLENITLGNNKPRRTSSAPARALNTINRSRNSRFDNKKPRHETMCIERHDTPTRKHRRSGSLHSQSPGHLFGVEKNSTLYNPVFRSSPTSRRVVKQSESKFGVPVGIPKTVADLTQSSESEIKNDHKNITGDPLQRFRDYVRSKSGRNISFDNLDDEEPCDIDIGGHNHKERLQSSYLHEKKYTDASTRPLPGNGTPSPTNDYTTSQGMLPEVSVSPPPRIGSTFLNRKTESSLYEVTYKNNHHNHNSTLSNQGTSELCFKSQHIESTSETKSVSPMWEERVNNASLGSPPGKNRLRSVNLSSSSAGKPQQLINSHADVGRVFEQVVSPLAQSRGPRQLSPDVTVSPTTCSQPQKTSPSPPRELQSYKISRSWTEGSDDDCDDDGFF